jgi:hypothetical protein
VRASTARTVNSIRTIAAAMAPAASRLLVLGSTSLRELPYSNSAIDAQASTAGNAMPTSARPGGRSDDRSGRCQAAATMTAKATDHSASVQPPGT